MFFRSLPRPWVKGFGGTHLAGNHAIHWGKFLYIYGNAC